MKVWISRDALTRGVYEINARTVDDNGRPYHGTAYTDPRDKYDESTVFYLGEWHANRYDAVQQAQRMRDEKITSLEQQIAKLRALEF